jgi:secreted protein with Ig-like and vWFA domain
MNPEQITAWVLDELSPEERAQIQALLKEDVQVFTQAEDTKNFCDFLTHELGGDSLALTSEQRENLAKTEMPVSNTAPVAEAAPARTTYWTRYKWMNLAAAAAVVMGSTVLIRQQMEQASDFSISESPYPKASGTVLGHDSSLTESAKKEGATLKVFEMAPPPPPASPMVRKPAVPSEGDSRRDVAATSMAQRNFENELRADPVNSAARSGMQKEEAKSQLAAEPAPAPDHRRARMLNEVSPAPVDGLAAASMAMQSAPAQSFIGDVKVIVKSGRSAGESTIMYDDSISPIPSGGFADRQSNDESYTKIIENSLKDVRQEPLSTFSMDVDTASYSNVRRYLNQNSAPPRDAVRVEELINYFPTDEAGPAADAKDPFSVKVEVASAPWQPQHRLARIVVKGKQAQLDQKASNLVFLVDVSGSMGEPNKLPLVKKSLHLLTQQLTATDRVSLVTYANGSQVVLSPTSGDKKAEINAAIDRLQSGGGTHGSAGIRLAYQQAVAGFIKDGVNRVILCSDGDFNVGISSPEELETYITEQARSHVFLSVLGFGSGNLKDRTMETLADKGNGNYAYIDSLSEARKVLVDQMQGTLITIAKDVKIQVEFNPSAIRQYRLIGYENRLLAKEDFNDDTKDAGEIGAGHTVTALYELIPANLPPGTEPRPPVDDLKYQPEANTSPRPHGAAPASLLVGNDEVLTVKVRYKDPEGSTSRLLEVPLRDTQTPLAEASKEFKFSSAVAGFGLLLRQSSYAGQLTWDQVRQLAQDGKGTDPHGYRGEFLQLIEKARSVTP